MRRLLIRFCLLLLLLSPFIGFMVWANINSGELLPDAAVAEMHQDNPDLLVARVSTRGDLARYNYANYLERGASVVMIGSSLVREFDQRMFTEATFYNFKVDSLELHEAAVIVQHMADEGTLPDLILLNVHPPTFTASLPDENLITADTFEVSILNQLDWIRDKAQVPVQFILIDGWDVMLPKLQPTYTDIQGNPAFGMLARFPNEKAYRADGSEVLTRFISIDAFRDDIDRTLRGYMISRVAYATPHQELDARSIEGLDTILQLATANGVQLIGFAAPQHPDLLDFYAAHPDEFLHRDAAYDLVTERFAEYGFPYVQFDLPQDIGGAPDEMGDVLHSGKRLTLRMVVAMADAFPEMLAAYTDRDKLQDLLQQHDHWYYLAPPN